MRKSSVIIGFIIFGAAVGFASVWFRQHTDSLFLPNIPATLLGDAIYGLAIKYFGDPHSAQAHYTIPWLFRIPQVYVPVSILFWGLIGTLLAMFLRLKIIIWIMGVYLIAFGCFYLLAHLAVI